MLIFTSEELRELADRIDNIKKYHCGQGYVSVSIGSHSNGRKYIEFEQPSIYAECNSTYFRYDAVNKEV